MRLRTILPSQLVVLGLGATLAVLSPLSLGWGADATTERMSIATGGGEANGPSDSAAISADGSWVAFASDASDLVPSDTNGDRDIFLRERPPGGTERVSLTDGGLQANNNSFSPAVSGNGRYVAFSSTADNLVPGDSNDASDIFVRDRFGATTERVSVATDGTQGNGDSVTPSISADGRYVTFTSLANNLTAGDTNDDRDVFVHDRLTGETEMASVATDGTQGNFTSGGLGAGPARISADGRFVIFGSFADNLVPNDTNNRDDAFLRDRQAGTTERVSVGQGGAQGDGHSLYPSVSDDGRYVAFTSAAENLTPGDANGATDVFLRDRQAGTTLRISDGPGGVQGDGTSAFAVISADGRQIAFQSDASNLVAADGNAASDIFVYHQDSGTIERASVAGDGSESDGVSSFAAISANGEVVAFQSGAMNLVPDDTNGLADVFARSAAAPSPAATPTASPTTPTPDALPITGTGPARADRTSSILLWGVLLLATGAVAASISVLRRRTSGT